MFYRSLCIREAFESLAGSDAQDLTKARASSDRTMPLDPSASGSAFLVYSSPHVFFLFHPLPVVSVAPLSVRISFSLSL